MLYGFGIFCFFLLVVFWAEIKAPFQNMAKKQQENKEAILAVERIARVKALSDSAKDIEQFIEKNVNLIPEENLNALIERLEILKADKVITDDGIRRRIEDLKDYDFGDGTNEAEKVEKFEAAQSKKKARR